MEIIFLYVPIFAWIDSGADAPIMLIALLMFTRRNSGASRQKITVPTKIHKVISPIRSGSDISFQVLNLFHLYNPTCLLATHLLVWIVAASPNEKRKKKWNLDKNLIHLYFLSFKIIHNNFKIIHGVNRTALKWWIGKTPVINSINYLLDKYK